MTEEARPPCVHAVVLTGGRSRRFGGTHKPAVVLRGTSVLARIRTAIAALPDHGIDLAGVWVAGPLDGLDDAGRAAVRQVLEEPRFSGPLAGIAAAVAHLPDETDTAAEAVPGSGPGNGSDAGSGAVDEPASTVLIVPGDAPHVSTADLAALVDASNRAGGPAGCTDGEGRLQHLLAAWPADLLRARLREIGDPADRPVRLLWEGASPVLVDVSAASTADFDTPEQFAALEEDPPA